MNKEELNNLWERAKLNHVKMKDICEECGKPFNSEYHLSDECVKGVYEE